jgi:hypothetical protein
MSARARIYQQPKSSMQSGTSNDEWILDYAPAFPGRADPLMGWIGSADTQAQVSLRFATREEAVAYAERRGIAFDMELPQIRRVHPKSYADNFKFGRAENWTH